MEKSIVIEFFFECLSPTTIFEHSGGMDKWTRLVTQRQLTDDPRTSLSELYNAWREYCAMIRARPDGWWSDAKWEWTNVEANIVYGREKSLQ